MKIYLVRHGETETNVAKRWSGHTDTPLTKLGREQARALGERLAQVPFDAIYSSDLIRAVDTAQAVAQGHSGVTHHQDERFRERFLGELENQLYTGPIEEDPAGYESNETLMKRAQAALEYLVDKHKDQTVLLAAHAFFNKAFLGAAMGVDYPDNLIQSNTALNIITYDERPRVELVNCTRHLNH